ncbi:hypothetical protein OH76DRAFT_137739 [Lentinus brumalis]|uniref:Uncharacterized protein n=1 Tax=Lentinus brumalis TaxID=2498619 RepID=A0A371CPI5_9APHY|nr:hypothetical protein OH76DRAFT_137739 [Polyporus brumalis]
MLPSGRSPRSILRFATTRRMCCPMMACRHLLHRTRMTKSTAPAPDLQICLTFLTLPACEQYGSKMQAMCGRLPEPATTELRTTLRLRQSLSVARLGFILAETASSSSRA